MTELLRAGPETRITLHFAVRLMDGTDLDSTFDGDPPLLCGETSLYCQGLRTLSAGLRLEIAAAFFLKPPKPLAITTSKMCSISPATPSPSTIPLEPGMVLSFADAAGAELPGVISQADEEWVMVDFNHPLAGRDLTFEVDIISIERYAPEQPVTLN